MAITMDDRFAINAAIERLMADGDTFDPADAALLIEKVPVSKRSAEIGFNYVDNRPSKGAEGFAAGVGNVSTDDGKPKVYGGGYTMDVVRIGGFKLYHTPGAIKVDLMWNGTHYAPDGTPESESTPLILYDRRTKAPREIRLSQVRPVTFVLWPKPRYELVFMLTRYAPWKRAAAAAPTEQPPA